MQEKTDLRIQRTYKLLTDALMAMLCEQSFDEITVRSLCQRAMVRPATFYKHFGDKYELFTFMIRELQQKFSAENPYRNSAESTQSYYVTLIDQTLCFLQQNMTMVSSILNSSASSLLIDLLSQQLEAQARIEFREDEKRGVVLPAHPDVMAPLFTGALIYLAKWWVLSGCRLPREELITECFHILNINPTAHSDQGK